MKYEDSITMLGRRNQTVPSPADLNHNDGINCCNQGLILSMVQVHWLDPASN